MTPHERIAVVGMACRFPGGANDPESFWELLRIGVDAITEVPPTRWNASRFHHANPSAPGHMVTRWGGFVENVDQFDAAFFGIAPREATRMDPQQRWLAEVTWEAIEDAGLPPEQLAGTRTGVFVGISACDYLNLLRHDAHLLDGYSNTGGTLCIAANRLSYLFNLHGPSLAVDTACSSSLVALHLAVQSLRSGECDYAVVAAANELLSPETSIGFSQARMLSPRGRSRAFDAGADGYVRAEGAAAVLLMPARTAESRNLRPRAWLMATASNQDGHTSSLTVPNQTAQEQMMREALQQAGARPHDVVYVEAHGTGTPVGDPIEARAIAAVFASDQHRGEPLLMGSVKSNIGHLESAAGMAGLIKAVLVLEHRGIPPNLHFTAPNPGVPTACLRIPTVFTALSSDNGYAPLVAVNSFGFGGSNAHALLTAAAPDPVTSREQPSEPWVFPLSARTAGALADYAGAFAALITGRAATNLSLRDLCAAAALGKSHHPVRAALVSDSLEKLREQLQALRNRAGQAGAASNGTLPEKASPDPAETHAAPGCARPKIAFVFSGQGPQWWAMGRQLYERDERVREFWTKCDTTCRNLGGPSLLDALLADEATSPLHRTDITQPALFVLQASLVELWRSWGIEADAVIGHSVGEAAAAWAAGICTLEEIFRVIIVRSRLQHTQHGRGRMLAAAISAHEGQTWERKFGGRISIAALNAPRQVTLSGEVSALEEIAAALSEAGIFVRFLSTEYAFHSPQMDGLEAELRRELADCSGRSSLIPMISTVTGARVAGPDLNADYWWRNVRQPVQFAAAIECALNDGCTDFLEIGPHPVLASSIAECALAAKRRVANHASLRRTEDDWRTMLTALAGLYRRGAKVRWDAFYERPSRAIRLPAYPWQRQRHWHESPNVARELRSAPRHPLLGDRQAHPQPTWFNRLDARVVPWLADHRLAGSAVLPAAAYLEMAAAAVRELLGEPAIYLEDIRFHHLLFLPEDQSVSTCVRLDPSAGSFQILAANPDDASGWDVHAEGLYHPGRLHRPTPANLESLRNSLPDDRDPQLLYRELADMGQIYRAQFQGLTALRVSGIEAALAAIADPAARHWPDYLLFPPALDSCFHPGVALKRREDTRAVVVASIRQLRLFEPLPQNVWSHLRIVERSESSYLGDLTLHDAQGGVLAQIDGLKLRAVETRTPGQRGGPFYQLAWEAAPAPRDNDERPLAGDALIFSDSRGQGTQLAECLRTHGLATTLVIAQAESHAGNGSGITVDVRQPGWAVELWQTLAARGRSPSCVIFVWGWDLPVTADAMPERSGCPELLALARARLAAKGSDAPARWIIVTRRAQAVGDNDAVNPTGAALWGFARTMQTECPQWNVSLLDAAEGLTPEQLLAELRSAEIEPEVAWRGGNRWVRRLRQHQLPAAAVATRVPAYAIEIAESGRADGLAFRGRARLAPGPGEVEVEVAAAGLNFRDLMKVLGIYPLKEGEVATLGDEFSGRIVRVGRGVRRLKVGDRVMVCALGSGAFASHRVVGAEFVMKIPDTLSFRDAAAIPVVFGTAYHALHTLARLRAGETILIHAAAGGVGLAAVQLARQLGARVLATAGSEEKRAYLRSLGVAHVMDSRTLDFAAETMRFTDGRGVDVVLNSLAGAFQTKSLSLCAPHGRFVEIGKRDLYADKGLPQTPFQRSLSFFAFDLPAVMAARGSANAALKRFVTGGLARGTLAPLPVRAFAARDAVSALRLMQSAQHIGKIVLEFDAAQPPEVPAEYWPDPDGTYLVSGGLGGFGLATARWLAGRGARHLALLSRRGRPSPQDAPLISALRATGVSVTMLAADVANFTALAGALRRLKRAAPPLRGVFHAAMVLRDQTLAEMTAEELDAVLAPKMAGAWNLHVQTRELPLDAFVMFSSLSSLIGSPGQANYAAANAYLDALAHHRRAAGLPALTVNWGRISDVGVVADHREIGRYLEQIGVQALSSKDALAALPRLIASGVPQIAVMSVQWEKLAGASPKYGSSPVFRDLVQAGKASLAPDRVNEWRAAVLRLPVEEQRTAVSAFITAQLAATFGMPPGQVQLDRPLAELGLDSLMAVELKARIESHAGCALPINLFNASLTAAKLAERFLEQLRKSDAAQSNTTGAAPAAEESRPIRSAVAGFDAPLLRSAAAPLAQLIRAGELEPLTAAALMPWPGIVMERLNLSPEMFFQRMSGGRVSLDLIMETSLGSVGIFMLPLTAAQVNPGEGSLLPHVMEGIAQAGACGARCVALTGLIPSATGYGATVQAACDRQGGLPAVTTGHATTIAAVILNLAGLLHEAGRALEEETVMFYGVGSIGLGALELMLDVLPHPAELRLYDPYRSEAFFAELQEKLQREHGYGGMIRMVRERYTAADDFRAVTTIVGATNVENVIDVTRLAPGTLIVDDSWPHCMNGRDALARCTQAADILYTEGGFVRGRAPMPRTTYLPPAIATSLPAELQQLFSGLNPNSITACILSALLSVRRPELHSTIGLIAPATARQHWAALGELGFRAAELSYEGVALNAASVAAFRQQFGKIVAASPRP